MASVDTEGEAKLVFIEGEFSHAVRTGPLLGAGEGIVARRWERFVPMEAMVPSAPQLGAARHVLAAVQVEVAQPLLYARVDLLAAPAGEPLLGEVELVDPSLLLRFAAPAAGLLAEAITAQAAQCTRRA